MVTVDRRTFLKLAGVPALGAALPIDLSKALAIPAHDRTRALRDVEHVVFLMQENRSFDHYFGTLRGVRGFADPHPVTLPSGQLGLAPAERGRRAAAVPAGRARPRPDVPAGPAARLERHARRLERRPVRPVGAQQGRPDDDLPHPRRTCRTSTRWPTRSRSATTTTARCSGPTDPNRYHMWTGWVGNDGNGGGPVITNAEAGYDWSTYPERLERGRHLLEGLPGHRRSGWTPRASWGWTQDPFIGNYGDNSLLYFHQYQNAAPGSPLADRARPAPTSSSRAGPGRAARRLPRATCGAAGCPQVSWIVAPEAYTEHPNWEPDFGAWYVSQVVDILASNPEVWSKMVLFVTYDEEGGFFDHLVPPTPPTARARASRPCRSRTRSSRAAPASRPARTASACGCR